MKELFYIGSNPSGKDYKNDLQGEFEFKIRMHIVNLYNI